MLQDVIIAGAKWHSVGLPTGFLPACFTVMLAPIFTVFGDSSPFPYH